MAGAGGSGSGVRFVILLDTNVVSGLMRATPDRVVVDWLDAQPAGMDDSDYGLRNPHGYRSFGAWSPPGAA